MSYIDGFVIAVPTANKQKFNEHAKLGDSVFIDLGATRPRGEERTLCRSTRVDDQALAGATEQLEQRRLRLAAGGEAAAEEDEAGVGNRRLAARRELLDGLGVELWARCDGHALRALAVLDHGHARLTAARHRVVGQTLRRQQLADDAAVAAAEDQEQVGFHPEGAQPPGDVDPRAAGEQARLPVEGLSRQPIAGLRQDEVQHRVGTKNGDAGPVLSSAQGLGGGAYPSVVAWLDRAYSASAARSVS